MNNLAEHFAEAVRSQVPGAAAPPVDVARVARELGVHEIRLDPNLVEDGRLEHSAELSVIIIRGNTREAGRARRRFTLAHEVGHLLLARPDEKLLARRNWNDDKTERFCDDFAAALLLPHLWVSETYRHHPHVLATVRDLAERSRTSLAASLVRLNEILHWNCALIHWRRDTTWRMGFHAGVPRSLHGRVRSDVTTTDVLDSCAGDDDVVIDALPLLVTNRSRLVPAEVSVRRSSALALIPLSSLCAPGSTVES